MSGAEGGFGVMPGNEDLTVAEVKLLQEIGRELRLRKALQPVVGLDDLILIACPPSLHMLTGNALPAAAGVLLVGEGSTVRMRTFRDDSRTFLCFMTLLTR